jgi:cation transport ATPase
VVAFFGRGEADALALTASDIGVAVGTDASEISKSAADFVILTREVIKAVEALYTCRIVPTVVKDTLLGTVNIPLFTLLALAWYFEFEVLSLAALVLACDFAFPGVMVLWDAGVPDSSEMYLAVFSGVQGQIAAAMCGVFTFVSCLLHT